MGGVGATAKAKGPLAVPGHHRLEEQNAALPSEEPCLLIHMKPAPAQEASGFVVEDTNQPVNGWKPEGHCLLDGPGGV